jgi:hypothetical protein
MTGARPVRYGSLRLLSQICSTQTSPFIATIANSAGLARATHPTTICHNETSAGNCRMADFRFVAANRSSQDWRTAHRQRFLPFAAIPEFARLRKRPLR